MAPHYLPQYPQVSLSLTPVSSIRLSDPNRFCDVDTMLASNMFSLGHTVYLAPPAGGNGGLYLSEGSCLQFACIAVLCRYVFVVTTQYYV